MNKLILLLFLASAAWAQQLQTAVPQFFGGTIAAMPATCSVKQIYFATDATAGQNLYECTATNVWTQQLNSGTGAPQITHLGTVTTGAALTATSTLLSSWDMTLSGAGPYTFTMSGQTSGQLIWLSITTDATGFRSVTYPTGFSAAFNMAYAGPSVQINQLFRWNGSSADPIGATATSGPGVCVEQAAPSGNPGSGSIFTWCDSTDHAFETKNSAGTVYKLNGSGGNNIASATALSQTAGIAATTLCSTAVCTGGLYYIDFYETSDVTCSAPGSAAANPQLTWTDSIGTKSAQNLTFLSPDNAYNGTFSLGTNFAWGTGRYAIYSTGANPIQYSMAYTGCSTGTGTYSIRWTVRQ